MMLAAAPLLPSRPSPRVHTDRLVGAQVSLSRGRVHSVHPEGTVIDAMGQSRILQLRQQRTLELSHVHLRNGVAARGNTSTPSSIDSDGPAALDGGAAVLGEGSKLVLINSTVRNCRTPAASGSLSLSCATSRTRDASGLRGGAIAVFGQSELELHSSAISDCWAADVGGAVYLHDRSSALAQDSDISNCTAGGGGGAAVEVYSRLVLRRSTISACHAVFEIGMADRLDGGRPAARGGGVLLRSYSDALVVASNLTACSAEAGGAFGVTQFCTLRLSAATRILECEAVNGSMVRGVRVLENEPLGVGGSVHSCCQSTLNITDTLISQGRAVEAGGGIFAGAQLYLTRTEIEGCSALRTGGALHVGTTSDAVSQVVSIEATRIRQSVAPSGSAIFLDGQRVLQATSLAIEHSCAAQSLGSAAHLKWRSHDHSCRCEICSCTPQAVL
jgi:hypothetical protein